MASVNSASGLAPFHRRDHAGRLLAGPQCGAILIRPAAVLDLEDEDVPDPVAERLLALEFQRAAAPGIRAHRHPGLAQPSIEEEPLVLGWIGLSGPIHGLDERRVDVPREVPQGVAAGPPARRSCRAGSRPLASC